MLLRVRGRAASSARARRRADRRRRDVRHRAVAVADSAHRLTPVTVNLLPGQDVLTVSDMQAKIDALLRGVGCGFVPEPMVARHDRRRTLVVKTGAARARAGALRLRLARTARQGAARRRRGSALQWWLEHLDSATTRRALLDRHGAEPVDAAR